MLANGYEEQKHLYRGYGDGSSCTPRAAATHIFASTFARAKTIRGALALSQTAERDGGLLCCSWRKPSSCRLWLSRRIVVRATRLFDGRRLGETPQGRSAHRYRLRPQHRS